MSHPATRRSFKGHWGLTLLVIIFLPILLGLSYWQWQRGLFKESLIAAYDVSRSATTTPLIGTSSLPLSEFQPVQVQGTLDVQHQFFLDNQIYDGRAGLEVFVPMQLKESGEWILVNLGWLPRKPQRLELPSFPPLPSHEIIMSGRTDLPSDQYVLLGTYLEAVNANQFIVQALDLQRISEVIGHPLLPVVVLADPELKSAFIRDLATSNSYVPR